jgi:hypothetical protein
MGLIVTDFPQVAGDNGRIQAMMATLDGYCRSVDRGVWPWGLALLLYRSIKEVER